MLPAMRRNRRRLRFDRSIDFDICFDICFDVSESAQVAASVGARAAHTRHPLPSPLYRSIGGFLSYFMRATSHARSATISSAQTECGIGYACHSTSLPRARA